MGSLIATWDIQKVYKIGGKVSNENGGEGLENSWKFEYRNLISLEKGMNCKGFEIEITCLLYKSFHVAKHINLAWT